MFDTERLNIVEAKEVDIPLIMEMEEAKENRDFVWQGTFEQHLEEIYDDGHFLWLFLEKDTKRVVGYTLIRYTKEMNMFEIRRIVLTVKGIGYGFEVMKGIIRYAFDKLQVNRIWLDVYPDNEVGIRLYEKLGMVKEGTLRQNYLSERGYLDQIIYSLLKEEYGEWQEKMKLL